MCVCFRYNCVSKKDREKESSCFFQPTRRSVIVYITYNAGRSAEGSVSEAEQSSIPKSEMLS